MNICAIAAEYNPFHSGHEYHIKKTRQALGEDTIIIAVMSGNFVQRGDFAIADKYKRALCAVCGGADLVLELPPAFCLCSAEMFAHGMVYIADSVGAVTHLSFGCETDDPNLLLKTADFFSGDPDHRLISEQTRRGYSYAAARRIIASQMLGENCAAALDLPNNTLAVEYLKALKKLGSNIKPVFIKRCGSAHDQKTAPNGSFYSAADGDNKVRTASASFIRQALKNGDFTVMKKYMPKQAAEILLREIREGRAPACAENAQRAVLARLRTMREMDIASIPDAGAGLSHRIFRAIRDGADFYDISAIAKTKVYPEARIRRILMRAYLGVTEDMTETLPMYTTVLACGERGRQFLRDCSDKSRIPLITRPSESKKYSAPIRESFAFGVRADDMFALAQPSVSDLRGGQGFRRKTELI